MGAVATHLQLVTDEEAALIELRLQAIERVKLRYRKPETRRTVMGSLKRIVRTISGGTLTVEQFKWEVVADEDIRPTHLGVLLSRALILAESFLTDPPTTSNKDAVGFSTRGLMSGGAPAGT